MIKNNKSGKLLSEAKTPVSRPNLSDLLSRSVLDLIGDERLSPRDRLPSVRSMADRFSVAAPTLREALRRLQTSGVVKLRHGSGVNVRNSHERMVLTNPTHSALNVATILGLLDARRLIDPYLVELAVKTG